MKTLQWFEREFTFGLPMGMLPFYLERLQGTSIRLESKVKGAPDELLSKRYDGKWSVKENIGHLAEVDEISLRRVDEILNGVTQLSPAVFEPKLDYNSQSIDEVLAYFNLNRKKCLTRYENLSDEEMQKASLHPRLKVMMTPVDLAWFDAEHDDHHLLKITEIIDNNN